MMSLKPCLVMGTGFHRWVLGTAMSGNFNALLDWNELLLAVARKSGVALARTDHSLSLHWEKLLTTGIDDGIGNTLAGYDYLNVSVLERLFKKQAVEVLAEHQDLYPAHSKRAQLPLSNVWGAVVSLNFDAHWLSGRCRKWSHHRGEAVDTIAVTKQRQIACEELLRLNNFIQLGAGGDAKRLWFPNGYIGRARSLRLGMREFGFQPVAIQHAFAAVKAYERGAGSHQKRIGYVHAALNGQATLNSFNEDAAPLPLTWVTEMLFRPVCFAGVGMSDAELGLWALMVQRARNLANVKYDARPPACILIKGDDTRLAFWRTKPCGIAPLICTTWDEGWEQVSDWAAKRVLD